MTRAVRLSCALLLAVGVSACGKAQARTPSATPPLEVPAPPARVVIPVTVKVPEPTPGEPDPSAPRPVATGSRTRPPQPPPSPPGQPPPILQTTSDTAAIAARTRDLVAAARRDLARVDRRRLSDNARDQFDTAARFIRLSEDALAAKNYLYAQQLAESAAALANGLVRVEPVAATSL